MSDQEKATILRRLRLRLEHEARQRDSALFAVLDAARAEEAPRKLQQLGAEAVSLYQGEPEETLAEVAPYLMRVEAESELLTWVTDEGWGDSWGVFLITAVSREEVGSHLKQFLRAEDEKASPFYFRFYDPRVLRVYLPTCTAEEVEQFFGAVASFLVESEDGKELLSYTASDGAVRREAIPLSGLGGQTRETRLQPAPIAQRPWGPVTQNRQRWLIRDEQMEAFSQYMLKSFEDRMMQHLRENFASETQSLSDPALRSLVQEGVSKADGYGIDRERDVAVYVELMVLFGRDFDASRRTPWAGEVLGDAALDAEEKVNRLRERRDTEVERRRTAKK